MKLKKPLAAAGAVSTIGIASLMGLGVANAATTNSTDGNSLVDKIANTFHLNKDEVQKVFDQDRSEHEAQETANVESELTQLVKDGKITEAQKSAILAKRTEMQQQRDTNRESMQSKTDTERKAVMEAQRTALEKWAGDNGISTEYLRYVMGGHRHGGPGGPPPSGSGSSSTN